jgi:hypothetical protein
VFCAEEYAGYTKQMTQYKTPIQKGMSTNRNVGRCCMKTIFKNKINEDKRSN